MKLKSERGLFITLEGIEGVGKSTAMECLKQYFHQKDLDAVFTREPGGTEIAEAIRQILLQHHEEKMASDTELLLMFAARAQHLAEVIQPALARGKIVVSDRFTDATYAYQGGGRGVEHRRIEILEAWVQEGLHPDLTLVLDAPIELTMERITAAREKDRIEREEVEFFHRVRDYYLARAAVFPKRIKVINAVQSIDEVQADIGKYVEAAVTSH